MVTILTQKDLLISAEKIIQSPPPGKKSFMQKLLKLFSPVATICYDESLSKKKKLLETKTENF
jgi:hypothetical protein